LDVYGIPADGTIMHHWVVIHLDKDFAASIPDVGHSCVFFLGVPHREREMPQVALNAAQISKITKSLVFRFHLAESKSDRIRDSMEKEAEAARSNNDENRAEYLEGLIDEKSEDSFVLGAGQSIFELLRFPSSASVAHLPKEPPTVQRAHTASLLALELRKKDDENDIVWFSRVQSWVTKHASTPHTMSVTGRGPEYYATRIPLPARTRANLAIFSVVTGKQANWPPGLVKPPVLSKMPTMKPSGKLHLALNNMFKPGSYDKEKGKFIRASPNIKGYPGVIVNISYKPDATTVLAECRAITQMNSHSDADNKTLATGFFGWSNNFQERPLVFNFLDRFPGLARAFNAGEFTGEVPRLVEALKAVPYGWAFITGGPGSGKTTTAMSLVGAVISGTTKIAFPMEQDEKDDSDSSDVDSNSSRYTAPDFKYEVNAKEESVGNAKVAWTAGQNKLVDDAARRASLACPDKVVVRVLPWKREFSNLTRINDAEPRVTDTSANTTVTSAIIGLSKHTDSYKVRKFEDTHPSRVHASLSEMARRIVQDKPNDWPLILAARQEAQRDPEGYALNRVKHEESYRKLLEHTASLIDIAVGTPVSLADFGNHVSWVPHLIVIDEAARLSENLSLLLPSVWQSAFCIFIGDTSQFPPLGVTVGQRDFKSVFSAQRQVSLFHRMENAGKMLFRLRLNYRARVNAVEWAHNMFYDENMSVVHRKHNQASKNFLDWVIKTFAGYHTYATTLLIRPPNCNESMFGTSFSNEGNAHFTVQLVIQLYRDASVLDARDLSRRGSVLIITPYSVQKNYYDLLLSDVTEAEIPKSLVEVRTVDDSPSHEADIVIVDWVRTNNRGFIADPKRMCVALSRARIGTIMIGPGNNVPLVWPLSHLVEYCEDRDAAIDLKHSCYWDLMCPHCCQPGHMAKDCTFQPKCARCDGAQHATRNCPRNAEDAISVSAAEPITAYDGIERDAMNPPV
jgi:hypothetical protein